MTVSAAMTSLRLFESGTASFLEAGRRGLTLAMLAGHAMFAGGGSGGCRKGGGGGDRGRKVQTAAEEDVVNKGSTGEAVEAPTRTVAVRPRLPAATAAEPKPPKVVPPR